MNPHVLILQLKKLLTHGQASYIYICSPNMLYYFEANPKCNFT